MLKFLYASAPTRSIVEMVLHLSKSVGLALQLMMQPKKNVSDS